LRGLFPLSLSTSGVTTRHGGDLHFFTQVKCVRSHAGNLALQDGDLFLSCEQRAL
jgi:hypothetical protein